jgi:hypothetical protein
MYAIHDPVQNNHNCRLTRLGSKYAGLTSPHQHVFSNAPAQLAAMLPAALVPGTQPRLHVAPFLTVVLQPLATVGISMVLGGNTVSVQSPEGTAWEEKSHVGGGEIQTYRIGTEASLRVALAMPV